MKPMILLERIFSIQRGHSGREVLAITSTSANVNAKFRVETTPSTGTIPIGTVEYCEQEFGPHRIDFFPEFLKPHLHRNVEKRIGGFITDQPIFLKDATRWKSEHVSRLVLPKETISDGEWWVCEPVEFVQEWRYYIANGKLITTGWYAGYDEDEPAPHLNINWPPGFSAAADFGRLKDGRIALVECHAPFGCGWYGETHIDYAVWQIMSWEQSHWWKPSQNETYKIKI